MSVGRCQGAGQVALEGFPGSIWPRTRSTGGVRWASGETERTERGDEDEGLSAISKSSGTSLKTKNISYLEGSNEKVLNTNFA